MAAPDQTAPEQTHHPDTAAGRQSTFQETRS